MIDPRLHGILTVIDRDGYTADPHLEAVAVAQGFAYRVSGNEERLRLTRKGREALR
jgi:hypothetical protein